MITAAPSRPRPAIVPPAAARLPDFDRVLEFNAGRRAVARLNIPGTLPFFATHFPRQPILPGVLLLESMASLARAAAGGSRWRLRSAGALRFRHFVGPGDQVTITVERTGGTGDSTVWRAEATVAGRIVATARSLSFAPAGEMS